MNTSTRTVEEIRKRGELDQAWRSAWGKLACTLEPGRLQSRQERIEHRATLANNRVRRLMAEFDATNALRSPAIPAIPAIAAEKLYSAIKSFKKALGRLEETENYSDAELAEHKEAIAFLRTLMEHPIVTNSEAKHHE